MIKKLQVARKNNIFTGMAIGAGIGTVTGAIIGYSSYQEPEPNIFNPYYLMDPRPEFYALGGGVLGVAAGLLPGAVIGASFRWLHYDFTAVSLPERAALMDRILSGQP